MTKITKRALIILFAVAGTLALALSGGCKIGSGGSGGFTGGAVGAGGALEECSHIYGEWIVTTFATCASEGKQYRQCALCGNIEYEVLPKAEHDYGEWVSNRNGEHTKTCSNDSTHIQTESCSGGEATCTEQAICSVCGGKYGSMLGHNYENGVCTNEGCSVKDPDYVAESKAYTKEGDYIYFGSYPQTEVKDEATVTALNSLSGGLPLSLAFNGWISYEYYIESDNTTAFMWYKDIDYGEEKYRGVYFTSYRPSLCSGKTSANAYQTYNGYNIDTGYWFKYEPIKWRVLTEQNGKAFLLCDIAIDSQAYQNTFVCEDGSKNYDSEKINHYNNNQNVPSGTYANNYEYSTIRAWLNDNFYNTAFSAVQQEIIQTTLVDNSARSINPYNNAAFLSNTVIYKYNCACADTNDKIFLLSEYEITNPEYGFNEGGYGASDVIKDDARLFKFTDYTKVQGCRTIESDKTLEYCNYWLRSPSGYINSHAFSVTHEGRTYNSYCVSYTALGVVPALWIEL